VVTSFFPQPPGSCGRRWAESVVDVAWRLRVPRQVGSGDHSETDGGDRALFIRSVPANFWRREGVRGARHAPQPGPAVTPAGPARARGRPPTPSARAGPRPAARPRTGASTPRSMRRYTVARTRCPAAGPRLAGSSTALRAACGVGQRQERGPACLAAGRQCSPAARAEELVDRLRADWRGEHWDDVVIDDVRLLSPGDQRPPRDPPRLPHRPPAGLLGRAWDRQTFHTESLEAASGLCQAVVSIHLTGPGRAAGRRTTLAQGSYLGARSWRNAVMIPVGWPSSSRTGSLASTTRKLPRRPAPRRPRRGCPPSPGRTWV
jgi:hypothetical protein